MSSFQMFRFFFLFCTPLVDFYRGPLLTFILKVTECCLVNTKMEKSGIRFGNRTGCQCKSTPGMKVIEYYSCVNSHYIFFFNLVIELITCDLLCLFTGAAVRYCETKCSCSRSMKTGIRQPTQRSTTSYAEGGKG